MNYLLSHSGLLEFRLVKDFKKMNKLSNISYKTTFIADLFIARIINILSKLFKENTSSYILVYSPFKGEPPLINNLSI